MHKFTMLVGSILPGMFQWQVGKWLLQSTLKIAVDKVTMFFDVFTQHITRNSVLRHNLKSHFV